ncbi:MAG: hypothetical protein AB1633_07285 [Elusimicrobiota bacterium]
MPSIYVQKNSPHYWIRFYDKFDPVPGKRKKRFNSRIKLTPVDQKKITQWLQAGADPKKKPKINGNDETKKLLGSLTRGLVEKEIAQKTGIKIKSPLILSEGLKEYLNSKTRVGDRTSIKKKTREMYKYSVRHFITATGKDVEIHKYYPGDFGKLLAYFEENDYAEASRETFTNHLYILWNYFVKQNYCMTNIVTVYQPTVIKRPEDIPLNEFKIILRFYTDQPAKYEWVYYLLLTMARPSTALVQERSRIDFNRKIIEMMNVKGARKKSPVYIYPLFQELEELVKRIMKRPIVDGSDRLFSHFKIGKNNYTDAFWWWYADQKKLHMVGLISQPYELKQIRKTFPSYAINELGFSKEEIKFLLDHTDESVAENHYLNLRYDVIRERFEKKRIIEEFPPNIYSIDEPISVNVDDEKIKIDIARLIKLSRKKQ